VKSLALYEDHAQRQNITYLLAYEEWENSLTPDNRAKLGRAASPDLEDYRAHTSKRIVIGALADAAERPSASYVPDLEKEIDTDAERIAHYWVVSSMEKDDQTKWLEKAVKHSLTGFELKRSIEAGKVLKKDQIEMLSGQGSGIVNYHGIISEWKRWEKKVGADTGILSWPAHIQDRWLEDTQPIVDLR